MKIIRKKAVQFAFDPSVTPCQWANPGDTVQFECQDCYAEQITEDNFEYSKLDLARTNPISGPLYVQGAEPGDILKIEIQDIALEPHGSMCVRTGSGLYEMEGIHCRRFSITDGHIHFDHKIRLPIKPMIGVIGTSPASGSSPTNTPGEHGGNLDIRELGIGSILYLPVSVHGALLSLGDIHAIQGDGETAICGMEASGKVTLKVDVLKQSKGIPTPLIITESHYYTTSADPSLDVCSVQAAQKMHRFLTIHSNLNSAQTAMLLSMMGNLRISQVVNPKKGCMMEFPRDLLELDFIV